jgi:class 3 adenylate cyclase
VRCGIARGRLLPNDGDFFGLVQSEAARLCAMAAGGDVLASAAVVDDASGADLALEPIGAHQLRGLPEATLVYRLTDHAGTPQPTHG